MPDWDNSRAPKVGDSRVSPMLGCMSCFVFFGGIALVMGFIKWIGGWL